MKNPADVKLVMPPALPEQMAGRALTTDEVNRLLAGPDKRKAEGARDHALILTMLSLSLRVSEVASLRASDIRWSHGRDITRAFGEGGGGGRGRHYLSLAGSINAVNQVAAVLWRRGEFNQFLDAGSAVALRPLLAAPFSGPVQRIDTSHTAPPSFSFPPRGPGGHMYYFDVVFPSFVVIINRTSTRSWIFRYRLTGRGVFGLGAKTKDSRFLSIAGIRPNIFEAMLDLNSVTATLLEATRIDEVTIIVREPGGDPRRPQVIHTHQEVVEEITDLTPGAPAGWTSYGQGIFKLANSGRNAGLVPRLDRAKSNGENSRWPLDATGQQTYSLDGTDPDDAAPPIEILKVAGHAQLPVDWGFIQGLSFAHVEASGAIQQLLSGTRHLNSFDTFTAELLYSSLDNFLNMLPL